MDTYYNHRQKVAKGGMERGKEIKICRATKSKELGAQRVLDRLKIKKLSDLSKSYG